MKPSFHEDLRRAEAVRGSSDRGLGLTVGGILLLIAAVRIWLHDGYGAIELVLGAAGLCLIVLALAPRSSSWSPATACSTKRARTPP
jgi:hypothetical protein